MASLARSLKARLTTIRQRRQVIQTLEARLGPPLRSLEQSPASVVSLFKEWRSWLSLPESGTAEDEAMALRAALSRLRQDLGRWDGTEGAVAWLAELDREQTRGASWKGSQGHTATANDRQ